MEVIQQAQNFRDSPGSRLAAMVAATIDSASPLAFSNNGYSGLT